MIQRKRSTEDKRRILLSLTDHAQKKFDEVSPRLEEHYSKMTEQLGKGKMKELLALVAKIDP